MGLAILGGALAIASLTLVFAGSAIASYSDAVECEESKQSWAATGWRVHASQQLAAVASNMARAGTCEVAIEVEPYLRQFEAHASLVSDAAVAQCFRTARKQHAAITTEREACRSARGVLKGGDCFDPATVTIESVPELKALLEIDRAWRLLDRAAAAAAAGDCEQAAASARVVKATHPDFEAAIQHHAGISACVSSTTEASVAGIADPRDAVWPLVKAARASAAVGDCTEVKLLAAQLHLLDRAFHDEVFVRLRSVARCL